MPVARQSRIPGPERKEKILAARRAFSLIELVAVMAVDVRVIVPLLSIRVVKTV